MNLEFEKPILELESKISELRHVSSSGGVNIADEITRMQTKADRLLQQAYSKLTPAQKVQVAAAPRQLDPSPQAAWRPSSQPQLTHPVAGE